jgi:hypothetical protein
MNPTIIRIEKRMTELPVSFVNSEIGCNASHVSRESNSIFECFSFSIASAIGRLIKVGAPNPI